MEPIGYHVMCRLKDLRVIAPSPEQRRMVSRIIVEKAAGHRLLAFNTPDTHLHQELVEPRSVCGELVRQIEITIKTQLKLPVGFGTPEFKPILNQAHLNHAFHYILDQEPRHGLIRDPYHEASCLPDLLGLRVLAGFTARHVREYLPRIDRLDLIRHLGINDGELVPACVPAGLVVPSTLAAAGLLTLNRRDREGRRARRAAMEVLGNQVTQEQVAEMLHVDRRTIQRMGKIVADEQLVHAIRLQLGLRRLKPEQEVGPFGGLTSQNTLGSSRR